MAIIEWSSKYSVGIDQIDQQHKQLFDTINNLHDAMKVGKGKEQVKETIAFLKNYVIEHFKTEENLMKQFGYLRYSSQKKEHDDFVNYIKDFETKYNQGSLSLTLEVMNFLSNWMKQHILQEDFAYKNFFVEKGVAKK